MTAELIDRKKLKAEARELLETAQVSPKAMTALYGGLLLLLNLIDALVVTPGVIATFVSIFTSLLSSVLAAGFVLYCMAIHRGERAEYLTLFDGFSFVGKLIALNILIYLLVFLWSLLFLVPGIIATYRYRFALYNLYENPGIGVMEALDMSKRQTLGYKAQLFTLDLSYLGWILLASLPSIVQMVLIQRSLTAAVVSFSNGGLQALPTDSTVLTGLPTWVWALIVSLWSLAVSLFYLVHFQCVELGYFDTAKRTSGIGEGTASKQESTWGGPDGLGGF